jgi:hypothetical protein
MNLTLTVWLYAFGAGALALWVVARFPAWGPTSITGSLVLVVGAFAVLQLTDGATGTVSRAGGPAAALLGVVLPTLTLALWSCARLILAFVLAIAPYRR